VFAGTKSFMGGNVGIGTTTPTSVLDVRGVGGAASWFSVNAFAGGQNVFGVSNYGQTSIGRMLTISPNAASSWSSITDVPLTINVKTGQTGHIVDINEDGGTGGNALAILANGNIGMGVTNPTNSLDVKGNISCSVLTGSLNGTASYSLNSSGSIIGLGGIATVQIITSASYSALTPPLSSVLYIVSN
jgi:hypothetical protein